MPQRVMVKPLLADKYAEPKLVANVCRLGRHCCLQVLGTARPRLDQIINFECHRLIGLFAALIDLPKISTNTYYHFFFLVEPTKDIPLPRRDLRLDFSTHIGDGKYHST